jgi:hypothetical protein
VNKLFYILDRYKYGFVAAFAVYIGVFIYLELETVERAFPIQPFFDQSSVEIIKEELELTPENVEIQSNQQAGPVKNMARDVHDTRQRSMDDYTENKAMSSSNAKSVEQSVKDYERQLFAETGGAEKRKAIQQEMDNRKNQAAKSSSSATKQSPTNQKGGNTAFAGNVMVDWSLADRSPHQNNNWYVRNPGYTCGHGSAGRVFVQIAVNANGSVTNALYVPAKSSNANGCMIEQALKYAKLSRFSYSANAPKTQEGSISYTFISQ